MQRTLVASAAVALLSVMMGAQTGKPTPKPDFKTVAPFLKKHCYSCHSGENAADGIDFSKFQTQADVDKAVRVFKKSAREVTAKKMPPASAKVQPTAAEVKAFVDYCNSLGKPKA